VIVRWFNWSGEATELAAIPAFAHERMAMSDVLERRGETLESDSGGGFPVGPHRIVTLAITPQLPD